MVYKIKTIAFHITKACSHKCPFCYASSSNKVKKPNHATLVKVINAFASNGVEEIVFLGGDPCSYPRLLELCEMAKDLKMNTTVLSNSHVYPRDQIDHAAKVIDCLETTIHGPTPEEHNVVALKEKAFEKVIDNLRMIGDKAKSIGIIYNITPQNCRQIFDTVENLIDNHHIPIDHLVLQRIVPQGRARTTSKFTIGCSHAIAALEDVERVVSKYHIRIFLEDPFPFCVVPDKFHKYLSRCEWGFTRAAIDSNGNLSRCGADPRYKLGNILETPLLELWNTSPILISFRSKEYLPRECHKCELLEKCGGGCALSCEIERDHGPDYLHYEQSKAIVPSGTSFNLRHARREDLSDVLRIEWACFPSYEFKFTPKSILKWYKYNPQMFYVLEDSNGHILGYTCMVPLTKVGFSNISDGKASSLQELEYRDVYKMNNGKIEYCHIEVLSTIADLRSRAGRTLIRKIVEFLVERVNITTASPITYIGRKLCNYFGFEKMAIERTKSSIYDIYALKINQIRLRQMLERF